MHLVPTEAPQTATKHALEHSHSFGPIHETMLILQYQGKEPHLNTIERYFIYKEFSNNNHLNDEFNITPKKSSMPF